LEVVVVDDRSIGQGASELLAGTEWPNMRVIRQPNAGPAAARNRAIAEATGEYILPLDADDLLEPGYAAKAAAVLDAQPDVGIVYCRAVKFGAEEGPWELPPFSKDELALGNVIFASAMFRKSDWERVGGFDETLRHGMEDYDFWIRLVQEGRGVVQLPEVLFRYRVREGSRTALFEQDREQVVATYAAIFRKNRDFFAEHAEALFQQRFALLKDIDALHARLAKESYAAAAERTVLLERKAEADRYNASLLQANAGLVAEIGQVRKSYARMRSRFRWLWFFWPRQCKGSETPE
jgi:GT2 family glycosyltransferase